MDGLDNPRLPKTPSPPLNVEPEAEVLRIGCYEDETGTPGAWCIDRESAVRHMLAIGSSGSGKTNLLTAVIRGLLSWHKDNRSRRPGLLIFDLKGGNFPEQVEEWARREGRADDVVHLSLTSKSGYDLFGTFNTPEQISAQTEKLLFAAGSVSERDQFWDQTRYALIHAALSCLLCVDRERRSFQRWIYLLSSWLTSEEASEEHRELLNQFELHVESMQEADPNRTQLRRAVETLKSWGGGAWDLRTRANIVATTHMLFNPLLESSAQRFFGVGREHNVSVQSVLNEGKILILSVNAVVEPRLATFASRLIKSEFYEAAFARKMSSHSKPRLFAMICDEYQLACTAGTGSQRFNDVVALPLLREFGAMVCAATQSLAALDASVGVQARRVLLPNFSSVCFFRTNEKEVEELAEQMLGLHVTEEVIVELSSIESAKDLIHTSKRTLRRLARRPICPRGALAQMEPGQAFVHQSGTRMERPVWFELQSDSPP